MGIELHSVGSAPGLRLTQRIRQIPWSLVILITMVASMGFVMLYSAAGGSPDPWMDRQMVRYAVGVGIMLAIGMVDLPRLAKIAYPLYAVAFVLLVYVEFAGEIGMGAQRWIDLKFFQLQPSELMKISLCLVLARYFHGLSYEEIGRPWVLIPPTLMAVVPAGPGAEAARPRHRRHAADGGRGGLLRRRRALVEVRDRVRARHRRFGRRLELRLAARLSEGAPHHLPRSRPGRARHRLSHHAVQDRARLRRPVGQGPDAGLAGAAGVPARAPHRLHLHHAGRGAGHGRRPAGAGALFAAGGLWPRHRARARAAISGACWRSASP